MTLNTPLGEVAHKVGLSLQRVKEIKGWIQEFHELHPEQTSVGKVQHQDLIPEATIGLIRHIGEKMWVPDPDDIPLDFLGPGSGFRTCVLGGRPFFWDQEDGEVARCWLTDAEDAQLREVIALVGDQAQEIGNEYEQLQALAVEYVNKARRYVWRVMDGDFVPIHELRSAILSGLGELGMSSYQFATSKELMDDLPGLRGQVEEFPRDLEVAIIGINARAGT